MATASNHRAARIRLDSCVSCERRPMQEDSVYCESCWQTFQLQAMRYAMDSMMQKRDSVAV